jgi:hypothetical protein
MLFVPIRQLRSLLSTTSPFVSFLPVTRHLARVADRSDANLMVNRQRSGTSPATGLKAPTQQHDFRLPGVPIGADWVPAPTDFCELNQGILSHHSGANSYPD